MLTTETKNEYCDMVKKETVEKWGFNEIKVTSNEDGQATELSTIRATKTARRRKVN